ncbi:MAG: hypothetical protein J6R91_06855, partial [Bacteroidaceae bacterium]|nr:hypothetical protein [Bacteroidaceae bacterium]
HNLEQLTEGDVDELERILWQELGSKDEYANLTAGMPYGNHVGAFIRSLVKVDWKVARDKFSAFISDNELNYEQEEFLKTVVQYVCENGDISREVVVNEEPFCDQLNPLFSEYLMHLANYIDTIHNVIIPKKTTTYRIHDLNIGMAANEVGRYQ